MLFDSCRCVADCILLFMLFGKPRELSSGNSRRLDQVKVYLVGAVSFVFLIVPFPISCFVLFVLNLAESLQFVAALFYDSSYSFSHHCSVSFHFKLDNNCSGSTAAGLHIRLIECFYWNWL